VSYPEITIQGDINLTELIEKMIEERVEGIGATHNLKGDILKLEGSDTELSKRINSLRDCLKVFQDSLVVKRIENLEKEIRELKGLPVKLSTMTSQPVKMEIVKSQKRKVSKKGEPMHPPANPTMWDSKTFEQVAHWIEDGKPSKHLIKLLKPMGLAKPKQLRICGYIVGQAGTSVEIASACGTDFTYVYNIKKRLAEAQFPKWSEDLLK
jgi:hypothetical protein